MREFIKELKRDQKINLEKGLENKIDIDYVIKRLEDISPLESYLKGEIAFNIENIINDNYMEREYEEDFDKVSKLTDEDIQKICDKLVNSNYFMEELNSFTNEEIENEIYHYVNKLKLESHLKKIGE